MKYTQEEIKKMSPEKIELILNWTSRHMMMLNMFVLGLYHNLDSYESFDDLEFDLENFFIMLAQHDVAEIKGDL